MLTTRSTRLGALALVLALAAISCNGSLNKAYLTNVERTHALFAFTGAPVGAPSGISFVSGGSVPVDASFGFDIAFDFDPSGAVRVYPVRSLAGGLTGVPKRIGMQIVPGSFEAITEAPTTGYDTTGFKVVTPGTPMVFQSVEAAAYCAYDLSQIISAKVVIDSVNAAQHRIWARSVFDPNCGYRGLVADSIPTR